VERTEALVRYGSGATYDEIEEKTGIKKKVLSHHPLKLMRRSLVFWPGVTG
jgi:hypothetical protein